MDFNPEFGKSFGKLSELYDAVRPSYPKELFSKVIEFTNLSQSSKILEVGCGSGQATLPFAKLGCGITALDISANMITLARRKTSTFSNVEYVTFSFEAAILPSNYFDMIFSGTAFHWVDPAMAHIKVARLLKREGVLALFWYNFEQVGLNPPVASLFREYGYDSKTATGSKQYVLSEKQRIEDTLLFEPVEVHNFPVSLTYSKVDYLKFVSTFFWVSTMPFDQKRKFFTELEKLLILHDAVTFFYPVALLLTKKK